MGKERGLGTVGYYILYCTVHTAPETGMRTRPIVSHCAGPIPCPIPGTGSMQRE